MFAEAPLHRKVQLTRRALWRVVHADPSANGMMSRRETVAEHRRWCARDAETRDGLSIEQILAEMTFGEV